ncbi:hypothetical protein [Herpetosiphon gulosus]|uniref:Uncharacterized protein n=1 Tax=Herpetosiphon gulosus TaxID=1973496 RepID=A0ABP9X7U4_9CHLR
MAVQSPKPPIETVHISNFPIIASRHKRAAIPSQQEPQPTPLPQPTLPDELRAMHAWTPWIAGNNDAKFRKIPCDATGAAATNYANSPMNLQDARSIAQAAGENYKKSRATGVGIVLQHAHCLVIDLDDCFDQGQFTTDHARIVASIVARKTYAEVSPSKRGVKIFGRIDDDTCSQMRELIEKINTKTAFNIELLHASLNITQFAAVTGKRLESSPRVLADISTEVKQLIAWCMANAPAKTPTKPARIEKNQAASDDLQPSIEVSFNQAYTVLDILERNGGTIDRRNGGKAGRSWHCPCGAHTGKDGSLLIKQSNDPAKYGLYLVNAKNPACALWSNNRGTSAFDAMKILEAGGDHNKARDIARHDLALPAFERQKSSVIITSNPIHSERIMPLKNSEAQTTLSHIKDRLMRESISKSQRIILASMIDCADENLCFQVSFDALAVAANATKRTAINCVNALIKLGFIRRYVTSNGMGGHAANTYQLCNHGQGLEKNQAPEQSPAKISPLVDSVPEVKNSALKISPPVDSGLVGDYTQNCPIFWDELAQESGNLRQNFTPLLN